MRRSKTSHGREAREGGEVSCLFTFADVGREFPKQLIHVSEEEAVYHISFWSVQMGEHTLFFHLGIEEPKIKEQAADLYHEWLRFIRAGNWTNERVLVPLLRRTREAKVHVTTRLRKKEWLGWIFLLFADHTLREADYFIDKLQGVEMGPREELLFWNSINADHGDFATHLFDPTERRLFVEAGELADRVRLSIASLQCGTPLLKNVSPHEARRLAREEEHECGEGYDEGCLQQVIVLSRKLTEKQLALVEELGQGIEEKTVSTLVHPALAKHVLRETKRSIEALEEASGTQGRGSSSSRRPPQGRATPRSRVTREEGDEDL